MLEKTPIESFGLSIPQEGASGALSGECDPLRCGLETHLYPRRTPSIPGRRHVHVYDVDFQGERIVTCSPDPEFALAGALVAKGLTGKVTVRDGTTGKPRTIVNIEKAALLRTTEPSGKRAHFTRCIEAGDAN